MTEYFTCVSYELYEKGYYTIAPRGWIEVKFKTLEIPKLKLIVEKCKGFPLNVYEDLVFTKFKFQKIKLKDKIQFSSVNELTYKFRAYLTITYYEDI